MRADASALPLMPLNPPQTRRAYRMTLGYPPDPAPSPPPARSTAPSGGLRSVASRVVVGVCVGVGGTAALLAVCYAVVLVAGERRRRRALSRRSLFGRTLAPGASPSTTLVVTVRCLLACIAVC